VIGRRLSMKQTTLFLIFVFVLLLSFQKTTCYAQLISDRFVQIIESLEGYAKEKGIKLEKDEDIRDVVSLGYLNAVKKLKVPFGHLDEKVKKETTFWLSVWCWFPFVPPERKEKSKNDLKKIRKALSLNTYKRTLAGLGIMPGFAVSCVGEVLSIKQYAENYPFSSKGSEIFYALMYGKYPNAKIVETLNSGKIEYNDLIIPGLSQKYLK
jgi:hypothetical protein